MTRQLSWRRILRPSFINVAHSVCSCTGKKVIETGENTYIYLNGFHGTSLWITFAVGVEWVVAAADLLRADLHTGAGAARVFTRRQHCKQQTAPTLFTAFSKIDLHENSGLMSHVCNQDMGTQNELSSFKLHFRSIG